MCVVAVAGEHADTLCGRGPEPGAVQWRLSPLPGGRSVIFGVVPDAATAVEVSVGGRTATVHAGLNVFGGVLPFPAGDADSPLPELVLGPTTGEPRVGVVDAGGDSAAIRDRLVAAGYETTGAVTTGSKPQLRTVVWWRPGQVSREETARIAAIVGADERREVGGFEPASRPVLETDAPVVVVVGSR